MADSDNSTTLTALINRRRRRIVCAEDVASAAQVRIGGWRTDPAWKLWEDWKQTHYAASVLCRFLQRREGRILRETHTPSGVEHGLARCGHQAARSAELAAMDGEETLLTALAATPASSLPGVLVKLEIIASAGEGRAGMNEFPWPQIQSTMTDLRHLLAGSQDAAAIGSIELARS
jgi:hypothetical protein